MLAAHRMNGGRLGIECQQRINSQLFEIGLSEVLDGVGQKGSDKQSMLQKAVELLNVLISSRVQLTGDSFKSECEILRKMFDMNSDSEGKDVEGALKHVNTEVARSDYKGILSVPATCNSWGTIVGILQTNKNRWGCNVKGGHR